MFFFKKESESSKYTFEPGGETYSVAPTCSHNSAKSSSFDPLVTKSLEYLIVVFISNNPLINKIKSIERLDKFLCLFLNILKKS